MRCLQRDKWDALAGTYSTYPQSVTQRPAAA